MGFRTDAGVSNHRRKAVLQLLLFDTKKFTLPNNCRISTLEINGGMKQSVEGNCPCLKSSKFYRTWGFKGWLRSVRTRRVDEKLVFNHPCTLL